MDTRKLHIKTLIADLRRAESNLAFASAQTAKQAQMYVSAAHSRLMTAIDELELVAETDDDRETADFLAAIANVNRRMAVIRAGSL